MLLIRRFELKMLDLYKEKARKGEFLGALHSYEGEEAIAAGVCAALRKDDYVFSTHRGHGHAVAKGADLPRMFAELLGKETGYSKGRGGSMHLFDPEIGLMGGNGIVGGGTTLALGTGIRAQYVGTDQVTVCFFGEGAASQGPLHESINMAAVWKLPVIYVCENNQYAATTHVSYNYPTEDLSGRGPAYDIPVRVVDGNDVLAVHEAAAELVKIARQGGGPSLIEAVTYRHRAHCMVITEHRTQEEMDEWHRKDPIPRFEKALLDDGTITEAALEKLKADVDEIMEKGAEFGKRSPFPKPETVADYLWAE